MPWRDGLRLRAGLRDDATSASEKGKDALANISQLEKDMSYAVFPVKRRCR